MDLKLSQPKNAAPSILVTEFGIITDSSLSQSLNPDCLIEVAIFPLNFGLISS